VCHAGVQASPIFAPLTGIWGLNSTIPGHANCGHPRVQRYAISGTKIDPEAIAETALKSSTVAQRSQHLFETRSIGQSIDGACRTRCQGPHR